MLKTQLFENERMLNITRTYEWGIKDTLQHLAQSTTLAVNCFRLIVVITKHLFVLSRRGRSVSELSVPRNRSESPMLDAQQHNSTALAPVAPAPMSAAAHPPLPTPCGSTSTAQTERTSTEMSCGSSAAAARQVVAHTAGPLALQSVSTMTPTPSGTDS